MRARGELEVLLRLGGRRNPAEDVARFERESRKETVRRTGEDDGLLRRDWEPSGHDIARYAEQLMDHLETAGVQAPPTRDELATLLASEIPAVREFAIRLAGRLNQGEG